MCLVIFRLITLYGLTTLYIRSLFYINQIRHVSFLCKKIPHFAYNWLLRLSFNFRGIPSLGGRGEGSKERREDDAKSADMSPLKVYMHTGSTHFLWRKNTRLDLISLIVIRAPASSLICTFANYRKNVFMLSLFFFKSYLLYCCSSPPPPPPPPTASGSAARPPSPLFAPLSAPPPPWGPSPCGTGRGEEWHTPTS